jgi:2C-methyl-D-erythritol 2,4-cyclodiphosphate synthase
LENFKEFFEKNKENDKDISMAVLYNHFENLNQNNFDDGNIDIDIDVNNPEMDNILNSPVTIKASKKCSS